MGWRTRPLIERTDHSFARLGDGVSVLSGVVLERVRGRQQILRGEGE